MPPSSNHVPGPAACYARSSCCLQNPLQPPRVEHAEKAAAAATAPPTSTPLEAHAKMDIDCCVAAWRKGGKVVRLHDEDTTSCSHLLLALSGHSKRIPAWAIAATEQAAGVDASCISLMGFSKFIVLSQGFDRVWWKVEGEGQGACYRRVSFNAALLDQLNGEAVCLPLLDGAVGYVPIAELATQQASRA